MTKDETAAGGRTSSPLASRLIPDLAHDLKVPLSVVLALAARLLESGVLLPAQRRDVASIESNAQLLVKLVQDLLEAARLDSDALELAPTACDVAGLVRLVASRFEGLVAERDQRLVLDLPDRLVGRVDEDKLRTVLRNLIANAVRFAPRGGVVRCSLSALDGRLRVEVADDGPGIPAALREAVLQRFKQIGGGGQAYGGAGLGLAIAHELIARHGGELTLEDAPEGGALAILELPNHGTVELPPPDNGAEPHTVEAAEPERPIIARLRADLLTHDERAADLEPQPGDERPTLLLVESSAQLGGFLERLLSPSFAIVTAVDLARAIAIAERQPCDLILASAGLAHSEAQALVTALRERRSLDWVPIVALTVSDDDSERTELLRSGAQDVIGAPFGPQELLLRLRGRSARRDAALRMRDRAARYRVAFDEAPIGMALVAMDGRYLKANRTMCDLLGYTEDELLTRTYLDITHPDDREQTAADVELLRQGAIRSYHLAKRLVRSDGAAVEVVVSASLVRDERDEPQYYISQIQPDRPPPHPPEEPAAAP